MQGGEVEPLRIAGGVVNETGIEIPPGEFGTLALGSATRASGRAPDEIVKPSTGGSAPRAGAGEQGERRGRNDEEAHQSPALARRSVGTSGSGGRFSSCFCSSSFCVAATSARCCFSARSSETRKSCLLVAALAAVS